MSLPATFPATTLAWGNCPYCYKIKPLVRGWLTIEGWDGSEYQIPQFVCAECRELLP